MSAGVDAILDGGQTLLDNVASNTLRLRARITTYAPILLTAENAIDGSVRVDNEQIRAAAQGLSRALGARGQMMMQQLLITAVPTSRARAAHVDDHPRRYRAVDAVRDG